MRVLWRKRGVLWGYCGVLQVTAGYCWVLLGTTGYYWVLEGKNGYWVALGVIRGTFNYIYSFLRTEY